MKKVITSLLFVILLASSASAVTLVGPDGLSGDVLSVMADDNIDGAVIGGTEIAYDDTPWKFSAKDACKVDIAITPSGSGFVVAPAIMGDDMPELPYPACIYGTAATVTGTSPKEFTVTVTASDKAGQTDKKTYKLKIYPDPAIISSVTPGKITWGKEYSFTPSATSVSVWEIASEGLDSTYLTELPDGLEFDEATGSISGTWKAGDDESGLAFGTDKKELTRKIRLTAIQDKSEKTAQQDYTLTFAAVAPVIMDKADNLTKEYFSKMMYEEGFEATITAEGSGVITWTVDKLPAGLEMYSDDGEGTSVLTIEGEPMLLMKAQPVKITATNSAGSAAITPNFTVGFDGNPQFETDEDSLPQGVYAIGMSIADEPLYLDYSDFYDESPAPKAPKFRDYDNGYGIIEAYPGPLTWKASGLPEGITLSYDKNGDGTLVELVGTLKKAGTSKYTITATNSVSKKSASMGKSFTVFEKPEITTATLPVLSTGKKYSAKLAATNDPAYWTVSFASGENPGANDYTDDEYDVDGDSENPIEWDRKKLTIAGTLTARPRSGKFSVHVVVENPAGSADKTFVVDVNGTPPGFITKDFKDFSGSAEVETSGTTPITISAYIDASTAKNVFGADKAIDLTDAGNITGLVFTCDSEDGTGTLEQTSDAFAFKNLPVTLTAENSTGKPATKKFSVTVEGVNPAILKLNQDGEIDEEDEDKPASAVNITAGVSGIQDTDGTESYSFKVRGSKPLSIVPSPAWGTSTTKDGISINITSKDSDDGIDVTLKIKPQTVAKEVKTAVTLNATNLSTKAKAAKKITVVHQLKPEITTKDKGLIKEADIEKAFSLKLAAKGSSPLKWNISADNGSDDASEILEAYGLEFKDGAFTSKKTVSATFDENGYYSPVEFLVTASNYAGTSDPVTAKIGIRGKKPTLKTKTITISRASPDFTATSSKLITDIAATDETADVKYSTTEASKLAAIGLAIVSSDSNEGILGTAGTLTATKGTSIKITADNYGGIAAGSVKFVINDPDPEIADATIETIRAKEKDKVTQTVALKLKDAPTGDTVLKWAIPSDGKPIKGLNASVKADNKTGSSATLTITVPKGFATTDTSVKISVTNNNTKKTGTKTLPFRVLAFDAPEDEPDDPDEPDEAELTAQELYAEDTQEEQDDEALTSDGTLTLGTTRTAEGLSASELEFIHGNGYTVAAVLPELSADVSGQYDIDVELDESAPTGAKLYWFAFPRNAEPSEDDEIIDFCDSNGEDTETVPENHIVVASPWLRENVIYAPVIMVK